jgi:hypothetical protein
LGVAAELLCLIQTEHLGVARQNISDPTAAYTTIFHTAGELHIPSYPHPIPIKRLVDPSFCVAYIHTVLAKTMI